MNLLVTGATGLIGAAVADRLLAAGHGVHALCRSDEACQGVARRGLQPVPGDLARPAGWADVLLDMDGVVHAAATFDRAMAEVDAAFVSALLGRVGAAGGRHGAPLRVDYTGGVWLYGHRPDGVIREGDPFDPPAAFGFMLDARRRLFAGRGVAACVVHPSLVWRADAGAIRPFVDAARANRSPQVTGRRDVHWPLVHADDLAELYLRALTQGRAGADYHGVCDTGVSVGALAAAIAGHYGAPPPERLPLAQAVRSEGGQVRYRTYDQRMSADWTQRCLDWCPDRRIAGTFSLAVDGPPPRSPPTSPPTSR